MLDSMLSVRQLRKTYSKGQLTYQSALLLDYRPEIAEDIVELMDSALDIPDLGFPLGDQCLLEFKLLRRYPASESTFPVPSRVM